MKVRDVDSRRNLRQAESGRSLDHGTAQLTEEAGAGASRLRLQHPCHDAVRLRRAASGAVGFGRPFVARTGVAQHSPRPSVRSLGQGADVSQTLPQFDAEEVHHRCGGGLFGRGAARRGCSRSIPEVRFQPETYGRTTMPAYVTSVLRSHVFSYLSVAAS